MAADSGEKVVASSRGGDGLLQEVSRWPTPASRDFTNPNAAPFEERGGGSKGEQLPNYVAHKWVTPEALEEGNHWPTPKVVQGGPESAERKQELGRVNSGGGDLQAAVQTWPTPTAGDQNLYGATVDERAPGNGTLADSAMQWPTPQTANRKSARAMEASTENGRRSGGGQSSPPGLEQVAQIFSGEMPEEMVGLNLPPATREMLKEIGPGLDWSTPRSSDGAKGSPNQMFSGGGIPLAAQAAQWNTPSVASAEGGQTSRSGDRQGELLLGGQAAEVSDLVQENWQTPKVAPGAYTRDHGNPELERATLDGQARAFGDSETTPETSPSSPQDLENSTGGAPSSKGTRSLNPLFVCALMNWMPGWTTMAHGEPSPSEAGSTLYANLEMEWSLWRARTRSALLDLPLPEEARPEQLSFADLWA